jgi:hypothetical protein
LSLVYSQGAKSVKKQLENKKMWQNVAKDRNSISFDMFFACQMLLTVLKFPR